MGCGQSKECACISAIFEALVVVSKDLFGSWSFPQQGTFQTIRKQYKYFKKAKCNKCTVPPLSWQDELLLISIFGFQSSSISFFHSPYEEFCSWFMAALFENKHQSTALDTCKKIAMLSMSWYCCFPSVLPLVVLSEGMQHEIVLCFESRSSLGIIKKKMILT